jgi:hypothetical protein
MIPAMLTGADYAGAVVEATGATLLVWAGLPKLAAPAAVSAQRLIGCAEVGAAVAVLLLPGRLAATLLAAIFLGFTLVHLRGIGTEHSCNCFTDQEEIVAPRAAALTAMVALLALGAAVTAAPSMRELAVADGSAIDWAPAAALIAAIAWRLAFSGTALLGRIADGSATLLDRGISHDRFGDSDDLVVRRSFLLRLAVVGSALAYAPLRYLLYPGTALAAVVGPWDCGSGNCAGGYTEFCCEINKGGVNTCPTDTFAGGWWMCTDYAGRQLCSEQGVRYYVDCNAVIHRPFPGGCRCGNNSCDSRRIACNVFRYGQCNTDVPGTTAVVCRVVVCENPASVPGLNCSAALAIDNAVCDHEAPCLEPAALELVGAGGA